MSVICFSLLRIATLCRRKSPDNSRYEIFMEYCSCLVGDVTYYTRCGILGLLISKEYLQYLNRILMEFEHDCPWHLVLLIIIKQRSNNGFKGWFENFSRETYNCRKKSRKFPSLCALLWYYLKTFSTWAAVNRCTVQCPCVGVLL